MTAKMHALITGGSSEIGKAIGVRLAAQGYDVSLIARREHLLADAAKEIRRPGQRSAQARRGLCRRCFRPARRPKKR